ncbi:PREDICTED: uncharacterized protein LOC108975775 [Bactrocera latifrons]|nr:PREDICTED: uncharacterized protein LOC108975775 [Bactrocera latifrons]XP_018800036.1 PREDICTED: uncharacterized protein LOC108975775 [Bactrocera latifrons]XP_018800037.1 PREDICTED: uncharacterized protein LOC108975775 [Bactrocera latifrons]
MLSGWYCRSMANQQAAQNDETDPNVDDDSGSDDDSQEHQQTQSGLGIGSGNGGGNSSSVPNAVDYKSQYRYLKRKLKFLIYENEFFQDALRSNQRRLLKVSRDRAFLLDRLLQYEKPENTSSESDETESSEDEATKEAKKRKLEQNTASNQGGGVSTGSTRGRKKKVPQVQPTENSQTPKPSSVDVVNQHHPHTDLEQTQQMQMSAAEVERHLQSRQQVMELVQDRAPATVPTEMFSNEPSLDSESNDHMMDGSSPTHVAAEECVQMEYTN